MFGIEHYKMIIKCSNIKQPLSNVKMKDSYEQLGLSPESTKVLTES